MIDGIYQNHSDTDADFQERKGRLRRMGDLVRINNACLLELLFPLSSVTGLGSVDESCDVIRHVRRNRGGTAVFKRG